MSEGSKLPSSIKRGSSKIKQKQAETKQLEMETKRMEERLADLKRMVEEQKRLKESPNYQTVSQKWSKYTSTEVPLKNYAQKVIEEHKQNLKKIGLTEKTIFGPKSFKAARQQYGAQDEPVANLRQIPQVPVVQDVYAPSATAINFSKAIIKPAVYKMKTLFEILEELSLTDYSAVLEDLAITTLETFKALPRAQMTEIGIKGGHQIKIIRRVQEQLLVGKTPKTVTPQPYTKKAAEPIAIGDGDVFEDEKGTVEESQTQIGQTKFRENNERKNQYNGSNIPSEDNQQNEVQSEEEEDSLQAEDEVILLTVPTTFQAVQHEPTKAIHCYECYRTVDPNNPISSEYDEDRYFCCQGCLNAYQLRMQRRCPSCSNGFFRLSGFCVDGEWYCSMRCSPNVESVQDMFFQWHRQMNLKDRQ